MKMILRLSFFSFFLLAVCHIQAQITGNIKDNTGEPLAFASIYVENTSRGTTSNDVGDYSLDLEAGTYQLVFQYVGYKQQIKTIEVVNGETQIINIVLVEDSVNLAMVEVRADAEDPAYRVIRKAIKNRKYYKDLIDGYSCDVYIKGVQKLLDAPEKIMGQELGDLGGSLDSNRQGIVYLSESISRYHVQKPDLKREKMISSKVSGNDNGFSFNQAQLMDFSFYDNYIEIERKLISPIANGALGYYRYKLMGTFYDEAGRLINKIEVIPKREEDPVYRGFIYIVEDLWNIHSTELILTGASIKQPVLDTLMIKQIHVPVKEPDVWMRFSQSLDFKFGIFGFKAKGNFTGIFKNYELNPNFPDGFFSNEVFKVEEEANEKDTAYWNEVRPVPLTIEEERDYVKKDSLQIVWESKEYLDSVDLKNNKFKLWNLLTGYRYNQSYKKRDFSIGSPLTTIQFDPVRGWYGMLNFEFNQDFKEQKGRWLLINPRMTYGMSEKKFRVAGSAEYNLNRTKFTNIKIAGGQEVTQYNHQKPISETLNSLCALYYKHNFMKVYDKQFGSVRINHEVFNGVYGKFKLEYARRSPLTINSNSSWFRKDWIYPSNDPQDESNYSPAFEPDKLLTFAMSFRFRVNEKYLSYPGYKINLGSKWPDIWMHYRKGISVDSETKNSFDHLRLVVKEDFGLGLFGFSEIFVEAGGFIRKDDDLNFIDYHHFNGSEAYIGRPDDYLRSFFLLPYYGYSTKEAFAHAHFQHHFNGFLIDKLPLLRKLKLSSIFSANILYTEDRKDYLELAFGIDNIGFKAFRLLRFDYIVNFKEGKYWDNGFMIGIKL